MWLIISIVLFLFISPILAIKFAGKNWQEQNKKEDEIEIQSWKCYNTKTGTVTKHLVSTSHDVRICLSDEEIERRR